MGRRSKPGPRYPGGKLRPESPAEAMGPALARYVRESGPGVLVRDQRTGEIRSVDRLAGSTLGRLLLRGRSGDPGGISQDQYDAGTTWAAVVHEHARVMGYELRRNPKSAALERIGGKETSPDPSDAKISAILGRWRVFYDALVGVARSAEKINHGANTGKIAHRPGWAVVEICYQVCVEDRHIGTLSADDIGDLRIGLNALAKAMR